MWETIKIQLRDLVARALPYRREVGGIAVAVLVAAGGTGYYLYQQHQTTATVTESGQGVELRRTLPSPSASPTVDLRLLDEKIKRLEAEVTGQTATLSQNQDAQNQLQTTLAKLSDQLTRVNSLLAAQGSTLQKLFASGGAVSVSGSNSGSTTISGSGKINLNTATELQLETLPGIGPAIGGKIIDYRTQHGDFKTVNDLLKVSGIGDHLLAGVKDKVEV